jgi:twitching motility protein PilT
MIRVDGDVRRINLPALDHKQVHALIYDIMNDKQRKDFRVPRNRLLLRSARCGALQVNAFSRTVALVRYFGPFRRSALSMEDLGMGSFRKISMCRVVWCWSPGRGSSR